MNSKYLFTDKKGILLMATICTFLWGSAYPAIKIGYNLFQIESNDIASKILFAGVRFFIAGIIVALFDIIKNRKLPAFKKDTLKEITILGFLQTTMQYIFFYIGLTYTTGVKGSIINGTGTFFSIILAHFICNDDKINGQKIIGCILGFIGLITVNFTSDSSLYSGFTIKGEGFIVIASLLLSISSIYSKKITKTVAPVLVTAYQLTIGGLLLIIIGIIFGGHLNVINVKSIALVIYMALISSVAFGIWTVLLKYNKVSQISIYNFLIPVFGTILSGIFLGEDFFNARILISLLLVSLGIYIVNSKQKHLSR